MIIQIILHQHNKKDFDLSHLIYLGTFLKNGKVYQFVNMNASSILRRAVKKLCGVIKYSKEGNLSRSYDLLKYKIAN